MSKKSVLYKTFWTTEVGIAMDDAFSVWLEQVMKSCHLGLGKQLLFWFPQMKSKQLCGLT